MNRETRNVLLTLTYYASVAIIVGLINSSDQFKSGPCTPNLDVLSFFLALLISFILLIINGILAFVKKKPTKYSFFIHSIVLISWLLMPEIKHWLSVVSLVTIDSI